MLHVKCDFILWFWCGLSEVGVLKDRQSLKVAQSGKNAEEELATFRFSWIWWCWGMKAEGIKVSGLVNWWTYECGIWRKRQGWGRRKVWTGYMKGVGWELFCNTEIRGAWCLPSSIWQISQSLPSRSLRPRGLCVYCTSLGDIEPLSVTLSVKHFLYRWDSH